MSLFCRDDDAGRAKALVKVLEKSGQMVSEELKDIGENYVETGKVKDECREQWEEL